MYDFGNISRVSLFLFPIFIKLWLQFAIDSPLLFFRIVAFNEDFFLLLYFIFYHIYVI